MSHPIRAMAELMHRLKQKQKNPAKPTQEELAELSREAGAACPITHTEEEEQSERSEDT